MIYLKILRLPHQLFIAIPYLLGILDTGIRRPFPAGVVLWGAGFMLASIAAFTLNEYVDAGDTDQFSADKRASREKSLNPNIVRAMVLGLSAAAIIGFALAGWGFLPLGLITLIIMHAYSLPPIRLKKVRYLDVLVQLVAWGVIPYFAPFYLANRFPDSFLPFIYMISFFPTAAAIAPILDISGDLAGGIFNTTVFLGQEKSLRIFSRIMLASLILGLVLIYEHRNPWYWLTIPPGILGIKVYGYALGNTDRPKKIERILLQGKNWAKAAGWAVFAALVLFVVVR